jgi:hypothetical protein
MALFVAPKVKAVLSEQPKILHRIFQREPFSLGSFCTFEFEQSVKYSVIRRDQSRRKFLGIDFRQRRNEKPPPLMFGSVHRKPPNRHLPITRRRELIRLPFAN